MANHHTVLVVGVTGNAASLGKAVVDYLLKAHKEVTVHILVRKEKRSLVTAWESQGVKVFEGDLKDIESLKPAVKGVDTVVSCVQGGADVIVEGQTNLLKVSVEAGVNRFYPSDFSFDLRTIPDNENFNYAIRKQFHGILEAHKMRYVAVYNGVFMETSHGIGFNFLKLIHPDRRTIEVYDEQFTLIDMTTVYDTARYTVESIFDRDAPTHLCVSGETLTVVKWKKILEDATGKSWAFENKGSVVERRNEWHKQAESTGSAGWLEWMPVMYKTNLYAGQGKHYVAHADRYPTVKPTSVTEFVKANLTFLNV